MVIEELSYFPSRSTPVRLVRWFWVHFRIRISVPGHLAFILVMPVENIRDSPGTIHNINFLNNFTVSVPRIFQRERAKHIFKVVVGLPTRTIIVPVKTYTGGSPSRLPFSRWRFRAALDFLISWSLIHISTTRFTLNASESVSMSSANLNSAPPCMAASLMTK